MQTDFFFLVDFKINSGKYKFKRENVSREEENYVLISQTKMQVRKKGFSSEMQKIENEKKKNK